jgi:NADH-quinone oxidoreductase subunit E
MSLSQQAITDIKKLMTKYPADKAKSALIPALHVAQIDNSNWLPAEIMDEVGAIIGVEPIEVYEVATFYSQFNLKPVGKYLMEVCQTGPCMVSGSDDIIVECLGACGYAPMMQLGEHYREHLTKEKIDAMIAELN